MRLLKCLPGEGDFELTACDDQNPPPYAILSHTWVEGQEVLYDEFLAGTSTSKSGYAKLRFCANRTAADSLEYFWVDTCCINKSTTEELSTAINSMFRWYQQATKCYVYMWDVSTPEEDAQVFDTSWEDAFRSSRWFTRGWTLQELLAPPSVEFFSREGKMLGSRTSLKQKIHEITRIPLDALDGQKLDRFTVEERMGWAAERSTTLKEDKVYCLLGMFGVFLPLIYGEGEEYAALRLKEEIEKRQPHNTTTDRLRNLVSSPLPFPRNELFVGRETQLEQIHMNLLVPNSHRRMTVYGLGGCGKSALVLEFAYRALAVQARDVVFWVPAMSEDSFELAYRQIASHLGLPGADQDIDIKKLVKEALSTNNFGSWLMIVDNADDPAVLSSPVDASSTRLADYLPHSHTGAILFTTRSRKAARALTPNHVLELKDMSQNEAQDLLKQHISEEALFEDAISVDRLLSTLAYLPLALVQAAAFINNNGITISDYVSMFEHDGADIELFSEQFEDPSRYREMESTVAKTWHISFDQIQKQDPTAADCLSFIACIDRINIPQSLLPLGRSIVQQTRVLGTLTGYAFLTERQQTEPRQTGLHQERFFDMHRLVHLALTAWLHTQNQWEIHMKKTMQRLNELVPQGGHERKDIWSSYLSHALYAAAHKAETDTAARAALLNRVGRCQTDLGQYAAAEVTCRQLFSLKKEMFGTECEETLTGMIPLSGALCNQGKYEEAEALNREALAASERVMGDEHLHTLESMSNLAWVLGRQGKYVEAEAMERRTLERTKRVLGHEHQLTLMSLTNLAQVLRRQGRYEEAEVINREVVVTLQKTLGHEHPRTLTSISNLAQVLCRQGKYVEAEAMNRQELDSTQKVLGYEHPDTLSSMTRLAQILAYQGIYAEAENLSRQTLALQQKVLGPEYPHTLVTMSDLALMLERQSKHAEAELLFREALAGSSKVLGPKHPHTLTTMYNTIDLLYEVGKHEEADKMLEQIAEWERNTNS